MDTTQDWSGRMFDQILQHVLVQSVLVQSAFRHLQNTSMEKEYDRDKFVNANPRDDKYM